MLLRDLEAERDRIPAAPVSLGDYQTRSWVGSPMTVRGEVVGVGVGV